MLHVRPFWVSFSGFVSLVAGFVAIYLTIAISAVALLAVLYAFGYSAFLLWPRLRVEDGRVIVRNIRSHEFGLDEVRRVLPGADTVLGATFHLGLVGRPTMPIWALHVPGSFGRVGHERMMAYAEQATVLIDASRSV